MIIVRGRRTAPGHHHRVHDRAFDHAGAGDARRRAPSRAARRGDHRAVDRLRRVGDPALATGAAGALAASKPWLIAFAFGLLHGLGFAGALAEVGLPQNAIPLALLFFNVGVEIGQLMFIAAVLAAVAAVRAA